MKITKISKTFQITLPTSIKFKMERYSATLEADVGDKESIAKAGRDLMDKCVWLVKDDMKRNHNKI